MKPDSSRACAGTAAVTLLAIAAFFVCIATGSPGRVGLDSPSWITGMLDAEYSIISGGVMPGGSCRSCVWPTAITCAKAV